MCILIMLKEIRTNKLSIVLPCSLSMKYSKASRYTASSCTDLAGARFWIGWVALFFDHLALTLLSNKSCMKLSCTSFFIPQKSCFSRPYCSGMNSIIEELKNTLETLDLYSCNKFSYSKLVELQQRMTKLMNLNIRRNKKIKWWQSDE